MNNLVLHLQQTQSGVEEPAAYLLEFCSLCVFFKVLLSACNEHQFRLQHVDTSIGTHTLHLQNLH